MCDDRMEAVDVREEGGGGNIYILRCGLCMVTRNVLVRNFVC